MSPQLPQDGGRPGTSTPARRRGVRLALAALAAALVGTAFSQGQAPRAPFKVTVKDEKAVTSEEAAIPVDPVRRINYGSTGLGASVRGENNETLHLSHFPSFNVDGQVHHNQINGGRYEYMNRPLAQQKGRKAREGFESSFVAGDLRILTTVSLVPTKPATKGAKRQLDSVLVHYTIENKGNQAHKFGLRIYMDVFVVNNDGALFAAPTRPGKILDAVILKDKELPPYVQMLQNPNLQNPGYVSHLTLDLGSKLEKPERVVLTRHGTGFGGWDMPAFNAGGDSALGVFWETKEIKPGGKRVIAYAYGKGIATSPENEGLVRLALGGSFEPGKAFDVTAYVTDPVPGQSLTLQLPRGMELLGSAECQPVPETPGEEPYSLVRWRARVLQPGEFPLRVRSSTGVTQTKTITVTPAGK
jgi:hypothetical protein